MGTSPRDSVVNPFLQSWDVHNVFVMGAGAFPQNPGYNPTGTVGALTYWAADAIRNRYLKAPGPLVQAKGRVQRCRSLALPRSEEHTSELHYLMRISYAV